MILYNGDALEILKQMPDNSVDLVIADPPYNMHIRGKAWDYIENYEDWFLQWVKECSRITKNNGSFYFWHNNIRTISELLVRIESETTFVFNSFCIWDKGDTCMKKSWHDSKTLRSWFNVCEYCIEFFNSPNGKIKYCNPLNNGVLYQNIIDWYQNELKRLNLTENDVKAYYEKVTGKKNPICLVIILFTHPSSLYPLKRYGIQFLSLSGSAVSMKTSAANMKTSETITEQT